MKEDNPNDLVSMSELQVPIRADLAKCFVSALLERFHSSENGKELLFKEAGKVRQIYDELLPLAEYCEVVYKNSSNFLKYYAERKLPYDAEIFDGEKVVERIEVTFAVNGQSRRLQGEAMFENGFAPLYCEPAYTGNSKSRKFLEHGPEIIGSDDLINELSRILQATYDNKRHNMHKYPNVTLLIALDFPLLLSFELEEIVGRLDLGENSFSSVKCINVAGGQFWKLK